MATATMRSPRTMTVFSRQGKNIRKRVIREDQVYTTPLLPGFQLPLAKLLARADAWEENDETEDFPF
jgi:hypothetical protein